MMEAHKKALSWLKGHPPATAEQTAQRKRGPKVAAPYARAIAAELEIPRSEIPFAALPGYDKPRAVELDTNVKNALAAWVIMALKVEVAPESIKKALNRGTIRKENKRE